MKLLPSHISTHVILSLLFVSLLNSGCFYKIKNTLKTSDLLMNSERINARILLKNHQMYQGEILKSTESDVTIQTSKDTFTIDRSQIAHIDHVDQRSRTSFQALHNRTSYNRRKNIKEKRYVIVHTEDFDCHIAQCVVEDHLKIVTGYHNYISKKHQNHKNSKRWLNIYNAFTEKPKNEMHIYMQKGLCHKDLYQDDNSNLMTLSFDDIEKVEFYSDNQVLNGFVGIIGTFGFVVIGFATNVLELDIGPFSGYSGPG